VRLVNRFLAENKVLDDVALRLLSRIRGRFKEAGEVLGLFVSPPKAWLDRIKSAKADLVDISPEEIEHLIAERKEARHAGNFKRGDEIRNILLEKGIQLLDSAQGTSWKVK